MKNNIAFGIAISLLIIAPLSYADESEVKLKRSCIKDNPVVEGESDPALLGIYAQLCDKKNKDNKDNNMILAAQQFQKLGKNYKALQIVSELESNNIHSNTLTDVKFLAGVNLANSALNQMREKESRYLSNDDTYPAVKKFTDDVKGALPATVLEKKAEEAEVVKKSTEAQHYRAAQREKAAAQRAAAQRAAAERAAARRAAAQRGATRTATPTSTPPPKATSSGGTPFDKL